jgi:hypothetical protein
MCACGYTQPRIEASTKVEREFHRSGRSHQVTGFCEWHFFGSSVNKREANFDTAFPVRLGVVRFQLACCRDAASNKLAEEGGKTAFIYAQKA